MVCHGHVVRRRNHVHIAWNGVNFGRSKWMPLRIDLVNMPFASLARPSLALTQLKEVTEKAYGSQVNVKVSYIHHDFGRWLGESVYGYTSDSNVSGTTGLGEWFFRSSAFPDVPDNRAEFWGRFGHHFDKTGEHWFNEILCPRRSVIPQFLDEMIEKYELHKADVVGFTSMFWQNLASVSLANRLRKASRNQLIVIGGANCEAGMGLEMATNFSTFDFVFSGPSLITFPKLIEAKLNGCLQDCNDIPGIFNTANVEAAVKTGDGQGNAVSKTDRASIGAELNINTRFELNYDDFFESLERNVSFAEGSDKTIEIFFETSRGCWWGERAHCTFCGLNGTTMAYRAMDPLLAQEIIESLAYKYGGRYGDRLRMMSVDNILPKHYMDTLFKRLQIPYGVTLFYEVKADLSDDEVETLAQCGVRHVQPGIESLDTGTLKLMRKGTTAFSNIRFLKSCQKHGVRAYWNLLVGSPGETERTYATYFSQIPLLYHLQPPTGTFQIRFDRFSPYFTAPEKYELRLRPYDCYSFIYPFPESVLTRLAYYFENSNTDAQYFVDLSRGLMKLKELVRRWQARWNAGGTRTPRLLLQSSGSRHEVIDSRAGVPRRMLLSNEELQVLKATIDATDEAVISRMHGDALASVKLKGLLFGERGRVMNLVDGVVESSDENTSTCAKSAETVVI
jgi:ribosomal peptide maturation radical SAM protein 1